MGGRNKNKNKKSVKKTTKPSWIKFVTNHYRQHSKKNKKWTFKDSLKIAKKEWRKSKKIYKAGSGEINPDAVEQSVASPSDEQSGEVPPTTEEQSGEVPPTTEEQSGEVPPTAEERPEITL